MGPYYDNAVIQRIEEDVDHQRKLAMIQQRQTHGKRRATNPVAITAVLVLVLLLPLV
ncbi:MAG: hypothetical protein AAF479_02195 [Pseudomonadota bacterium]